MPCQMLTSKINLTLNLLFSSLPPFANELSNVSMKINLLITDCIRKSVSRLLW